jgi:uncharacterized membrane protein
MRHFSFRPAFTFRGRTFKGLRGWSGKPLHPPLTDIPIGAYVLAAVFDVISCYQGRGGRGAGRDFFVAATYIIIAGAIVSLGTALTGFWDWWKGMSKHTQVWRTANWHMAVMLTVTAIVVVDIVVRLQRFGEGAADGFTTVLSVVAAVLVSYGATYGGSLVFDYQFNVESLEGKTVWDETEADQNPGEHLPPKT